MNIRCDGGKSYAVRNRIIFIIKLSDKTYSAVIVDDGNKIMMSDSELHKVTNNEQVLNYRSIFEAIAEDVPYRKTITD